jgi:hypothetical protein
MVGDGRLDCCEAAGLNSGKHHAYLIPAANLPLTMFIGKSEGNFPPSLRCAGADTLYEHAHAAQNARQQHAR